MCGRTAFVIRTSAEEVDVEDALVLGDGAFLGGPGCAGARVVDQHVEPPEPLDHAPDRQC